MIVFPQAVIGCPKRASYGYAAGPSASRRAVVKGRPRYVLDDPNAVETVGLSFDMTGAQFNAWQTFWLALDRGVDWFLMDLQVDQLPTQTFECHATGPFSAKSIQHFNPGGWGVDLSVEVVEAT